MLSYREVSARLQDLKLPVEVPLIIHASLSKVGGIRGGVETMLGALFTLSDRLLFPTFTYKTMVIPHEGPEDNGMTYGVGHDTNPMAEIYHPLMSVDRTIGLLAEKFRQMPNVRRSFHPILSFAASNFDEAITAQTKLDPLAPIRVLADHNGWIILIGVDHTSNTTIHYGEKMAGRKDFTRWALTENGVQDFPGFPGCSDGFNQIAPILQGVTHQVTLGNTTVLAMPVVFVIDVTKAMILSDPEALLCSREDCPRCLAIRKDVRAISENEKS